MMAASRYPGRERAIQFPHHYTGLYQELEIANNSPLAVATAAAIRKMSSIEQDAYDSRRLEYLSRRPRAEIEIVKSLDECLAAAMQANTFRHHGGDGVFLDAIPGTGKSTAIKHVLGNVMGDYVDESFQLLNEKKLPVGYVSVPNHGTSMSIFKVLASFLGLDYTKGVREVDLAMQIRDALNRVEMEVLAIDETQNLTRRGNADAAVDSLRQLGEDIGATVILSGYNLDSRLKRRDPEGLQLATRFYGVDVYDYSNDKQVDWEKQWRTLVYQLLEVLPLTELDPSIEETLWKPLFMRTDGSLAVLASLLTRIARGKIVAGNVSRESHISRAEIKETPVPLAAEQAGTPHGSTRTARQKRAG